MEGTVADLRWDREAGEMKGCYVWPRRRFGHRPAIEMFSDRRLEGGGGKRALVAAARGNEDQRLWVPPAS